MKSNAKLALLAAIVVLWGNISTSFAGAPDLPSIRGQIMLTSDLAVRNIFAQSCKCDLGDVDALYLNTIKVRVDNAAPSNAATEGTLVVTYHDLRTGSPVTVTRPIPRLEIGRSVEIVAVSGPVLAKKSVGIKAEVRATTTTDRFAGNNILIERTCYSAIID
jgi:hypothetical protein